MPRSEADAALNKQIEAGRGLLERPIGSDADYQNLNDDHSVWTGFNSELLGRMFTTSYYRGLYGRHQAYSSRMNPTFRDREQLLKDTFIREQISRLNTIRHRLSLIPEAGPAITTRQPPAAVDPQMFAWVSTATLRSIVAADYMEAQLALQTGANKAATIMAASALEGMFLDALGRESVMANRNYEQATKKLRPSGKEIVWGRAQLDELVKAAAALGLIAERIALHGQGARDARDTVHPFNELKNQRATAGEARVLLELILALDRDLASHFDNLR